jgi:hypothetical protein
MAWLFDAATDKVLIPSGWSGGVGTVLMWAKRSASASNSHGNNPFRAWSNAAGGGSTLAGLDVQGSARTTLVSYDSAFSNITGGDIRSDGGSGAQAGWHPIALVMNSTAWALFYNTGTDPGSLTKVTGTKAATGTVGSFTLSDATPDWFDGAIACVKVFSRALSDAEVAAELGTYDQVSATNLIFRGTLKTSSNTPETGTAMTAGSTAVAVVDGPTRLLQPGVFAGSAPLAVGALPATVRQYGAVAGSSPRPVGTLAASIPVTGAMVGQSPHPAGTLAANVGYTGLVAGSAPQARGTLAATVRTLAVVAGSAPRPFGNLFGGTDYAVLAGAAPRALGRLRTVRRPFGAAGQGNGPVAVLVPERAAGGPVVAVLEPGPAASTAELIA